MLSHRLKKEDCINWTFDQPLHTVSHRGDCVAIRRGPLLLGLKGQALPIPLRVTGLPASEPNAPLVLEGKTFSPVYHLMDPATEQKEYACQVLFSRDEPGKPG